MAVSLILNGRRGSHPLHELRAAALHRDCGTNPDPRLGLQRPVQQIPHALSRPVCRQLLLGE